MNDFQKLIILWVLLWKKSRFPNDIICHLMQAIILSNSDIKVSVDKVSVILNFLETAVHDILHEGSQPVDTACSLSEYRAHHKICVLITVKHFKSFLLKLIQKTV